MNGKINEEITGQGGSVTIGTVMILWQHPAIRWPGCVWHPQLILLWKYGQFFNKSHTQESGRWDISLKRVARVCVYLPVSVILVLNLQETYEVWLLLNQNTFFLFSFFNHITL